MQRFVFSCIKIISWRIIGLKTQKKPERKHSIMNRQQLENTFVEIENLRKELELEKEECKKKDYKHSKKVIWLWLYLLFIVPIIAVVIYHFIAPIIDNISTKEDGIVACFLACYGISALVLLFKKTPNIHKREKELEDELQNKMQMQYDNAKQYFCNLFGINQTKLNVELDMIFRMHPTLKFMSEQKRNAYKGANNYQRQKFQEDWYLDFEVIDTIQELLEERLGKKQYNADKEKDLSEYRKKRNENLDIKNQTMKPWECEYCGNINPPNEYSCIKCGAGRIKQ